MPSTEDEMPKLLERVTVTERYVEEHGEPPTASAEPQPSQAVVTGVHSESPEQGFDGLHQPIAEVDDEPDRRCPCPPRRTERER
jgi:hypothetical protein